MLESTQLENKDIFWGNNCSIYEIHTYIKFKKIIFAIPTSSDKISDEHNTVVTYNRNAGVQDNFLIQLLIYAFLLAEAYCYAAAQLQSAFGASAAAADSIHSLS